MTTEALATARRYFPVLLPWVDVYVVSAGFQVRAVHIAMLALV